jgi:hypothetical protein
MEIFTSTKSVEHKYEKSSDPLENVKIELQHENFTVRLYETPIVDAIFNVYGLDEKNGDKYESLIYVEHFDGQDCQPYIRSGTWYSLAQNRGGGPSERIHIDKNENSFTIGGPPKLSPINAMWKDGIFQWQCLTKNPTFIKMNFRTYKKKQLD